MSEPGGDGGGTRWRELEPWIHSAAIESSINGIAYATVDGRLTYVNAAFLRMWGYDSTAEVVGRLATEFWASTEAAASVLARVSSGGGGFGDLVGRRRNGEAFHVELAATLVRDPSGRPAALMASFIDITERVRALAALQEGQERLAQAIRVAGIGIFDHDQVADRIYWSPRQREIYGVDATETITLQRYLERVHPEDQGPITEAVRQAHAPGGDGSFDVEHRIVRRDGAVRWLTTRARTTFVGEGSARRPVRTVGAIRDITEVKLAEEERARLRAQLDQAQKLEALGQLAGGVAHDFNNMLAVILGTSELLRQRLGADPSSASEVLEIEEAALRARDLTRQLLAFSRKQVIAPRRLDLNEEVARSRQTLARLIGEDVTIQLALGTGLWPVQLDPSQVDQILMNLAANARDAMPSGGRLTVETANVRVDAAYCQQNPGFRAGEYVLLSVSDSGMGMDRATQARIFEPFFTTKGVGKGTGLGLATVYGIVAQNGGMVHVYSEPGHGTTFKIYFSRMVADQAAAVPAEEAGPVPRGRTVLLVEDEALVRHTTAGMLGSLGLKVMAAATPGEAAALAGRADLRIDLLLTDVVMPEQSGKALRDRIWALRPGLPVIFMSGYTPNVIVRHGVLEQGVRFLQKPFSLAELAAALRQALTPA